jgi:hypothetical protein
MPQAPSRLQAILAWPGFCRRAEERRNAKNDNVYMTGYLQITAKQVKTWGFAAKLKSDAAQGGTSTPTAGKTPAGDNTASKVCTVDQGRENVGGGGSGLGELKEKLLATLKRRCSEDGGALQGRGESSPTSACKFISV